MTKAKKTSAKKKATAKKAETAAAIRTQQSFNVGLADIIPTYTKDTNPNQMSDAEFSALVAFMREEGAIQTILLRPAKKAGKWELIDGHHRYWAAQQLELEHLPAMQISASVPRAKAVGIGLNRIRGEANLAIAGSLMTEIMEQTKWTADQLSVLTGYQPDEIEAITQQAIDASDDILEDVALGAVDEDDPEVNQKPYVLEISFADKATYKLCRRKLRKAAGKGRDLAVGLLSVLGEEVDAQEIS